MNKGLLEQYITFVLEDELLAFSSKNVQEIVFSQVITPIPRAPVYIEGIFNLRGKIVTLIDLKKKFNYVVNFNSSKNCILVTEVLINNEKVLVGFNVDEVCEVVTFDKSALKEKVGIYTNINPDCVLGLTRHKDRSVVILCPNKIAHCEMAES